MSHQRRNHEEKRSHPCTLCGKGFIYKKELERHVNNVHKNIRKFVCEVCGMAFKMIGHLNYHSRSHTGERPNSCNICSKSFRRPGELKNHLVMVHKANYRGKYRERVHKRRIESIEDDFPEDVASVVTVAASEAVDDVTGIVGIEDDDFTIDGQEEIVLSENGELLFRGDVVEEVEGTIIVIENDSVVLVNETIIEEG